MFNVLGAATYLRGMANYGDYAMQDFPVETKDVWILADVDFVLQDPPSRLSVSPSVTGGTAKYLKRAAP